MRTLGDGQLVQFIVCAMSEDAQGSEQWRTTVKADEIRQKYRDWPGPLQRAVNEVCMCAIHTHTERLCTAYTPRSCFAISRSNQPCTCGSTRQPALMYLAPYV